MAAAAGPQREKPQSPFAGVRLGLVVAAFAGVASPARADGDTVRTSVRTGSRQITVFTSPTPLRAGPVEVNVLVQDAETGQPVPAIRVTIRAAPFADPGQAIEKIATHDVATNQLMVAAVFDLPEPGGWEFCVRVEGGTETSEVAVTTEVAAALPRWRTLAAWLVWPLAAVAIFVVHRRLVRRKQSRASQGGSGPS